MADSDVEIKEGNGHPDPKMNGGSGLKTILFGHSGLSLV